MEITSLISNDPWRMQILESVASLYLPDCYVAAGFVRNLIWDHIHSYEHTPLNDVDIIYFDDSLYLEASKINQALVKLMPSVTWEVKNQARMHIRNGDPAYNNSEHAMSYWPEIETATGVRLTEGKLEIASPFGTESLLKGFITHNPKRDRSIFFERVKTKG